MRLWDCLDGIKDPRNASGRRYTLGPILKLLIAGLLSGRHSLAQIVLWGRSLSRGMLKRLGLNKKAPCVATLYLQDVEKQLSRQVIAKLLKFPLIKLKSLKNAASCQLAIGQPTIFTSFFMPMGQKLAESLSFS